MSVQSNIHILCENIHYLRKTNHLTQEEMAMRLRIPVRMIQLLEQNILPEDLYVDFLYTVCEEFGVPPAKICKPLYISE